MSCFWSATWQSIFHLLIPSDVSKLTGRNHKIWKYSEKYCLDCPLPLLQSPHWHFQIPQQNQKKKWDIFRKMSHEHTHRYALLILQWLQMLISSIYQHDNVRESLFWGSVSESREYNQSWYLGKCNYSNFFPDFNIVWEQERGNNFLIYFWVLRF